jgi:hypothetical protein
MPQKDTYMIYLASNERYKIIVPIEFVTWNFLFIINA